MDIGLYITDLLREQDEVSIPGLGTFVKVRIAGSYDSMSNSFRPPSYQLSLKESDTGIYPIIEYVGRKKKLSISSSEYFIKKFSDGLLELLKTSEKAEIKHLGFLHKKNDSLFFEALATLDIAGNFYGLKPIADSKKKNVIKEEEVKKDVIEEIEWKTEIEEPAKRRLMPILLIIFIVIIGAIAAFYKLDSEFYNVVQNFKSKIIPSRNQPAPAYVPLVDTTTALSDSTNHSIDSISLSEDSPALKTLPLPEPTEINESISFEIIGAAFAKRTEAENYIKQLSLKGIEAKIVENMPGKMLKISLGSFKDEQLATTELNRIQKTINKDAWLARVKPKKNPQ